MTCGQFKHVALLFVVFLTNLLLISCMGNKKGDNMDFVSGLDTFLFTQDSTFNPDFVAEDNASIKQNNDFCPCVIRLHSIKEKMYLLTCFENPYADSLLEELEKVYNDCHDILNLNVKISPEERFEVQQKMQQCLDSLTDNTQDPH